VSVARLKVPSKARSEYEKACDASNKNKFEEAEQHARNAIDKFQSYSAAWVMLGVILEEQHKPQEAGDACSHAVTIDAKYLPAYLCKAEFAVRSEDWKQVLDLADMALGLNSESNAYSYYYRAIAYLYMNNLVEAKKSGLQAVEVDVNHFEPSFYFLLAQIYEREGDTANAIAQLQQLLKHRSDRQDEAKQYLARLESQQPTK
jgi:tetratricopeptide (TPR) repeat protein